MPAFSNAFIFSIRCLLLYILAVSLRLLRYRPFALCFWMQKFQIWRRLVYSVKAAHETLARKEMRLRIHELNASARDITITANEIETEQIMYE